MLATAGCVSAENNTTNNNFEQWFVRANTLNCRNTPDSSKPDNIIKTFPRGTELSVIGIDETGKWWQVWDGETQGWCYSTYFVQNALKKQADPLEKNGILIFGFCYKLFTKIDFRVDLDREIDKEVDALVDLKAEVWEQLDKLSDERFVRVLWLRYAERKTRNAIAGELSFTSRYIRKIHIQALESLDILLAQKKTTSVPPDDHLSST